MTTFHIMSVVLWILAVLMGVVLLVLVTVIVWIRKAAGAQTPQERLQWWLDHSFPIFGNVVPDSNLYFASYETWSQAGKDIHDAGQILIDMFNDTDSEFDKVKLLYAMGAIGSLETNAFVCNLVRSTDSPKLRSSGLTYGLIPNLDEPAVQEYLVTFVKSTQQPLADRCRALDELLHAGNKYAIAYAKSHGHKLEIEDPPKV